MAALTTEQKCFIIQANACYDTPTMVVNAFKERFGITITRQQVESYDPTKGASQQKLAKKWKELFYECRERFNNEINDIPIANRAYRLRVLDRMAANAELKRNYPLTKEIMEQAAKEVGDIYTNKQKVDHTSSDRSMSPSFDNEQYKKAQTKLSDLD
ncbi:hypothetical protein VPGG_00041 [Vibrio phage VBM1]|uniref:hypothetical protein n=1 Tax=Vibrio phage VBM1 TaxID=754074 RepID=UPI0002C102C7|nr:hypothetical protein VPGG_00041 [Vibrio phage VBM1]AGH07358.1 hypothetical protein VPGG_00041 [Vibrio phage VBM1]